MIAHPPGVMAPPTLAQFNSTSPIPPSTDQQKKAKDQYTALQYGEAAAAVADTLAKQMHPDKPGYSLEELQRVSNALLYPNDPNHDQYTSMRDYMLGQGQAGLDQYAPVAGGPAAAGQTVPFGQGTPGATPPVTPPVTPQPGARAGALPMNDPQRARLRTAGSPRWNDPNLTQADFDAISKGAQQAGQAGLAAQTGTFDKNLNAGAQAKNSTDLLSALASLMSIGNSPMLSSMLPIINQALQQLGFPPINVNAGSAAVMPNGIDPATWDALPQSAKTIILAAWQARGGNPADFQKGIDSQRPTGSNLNANPTARYAPLSRY